MYKYLKPTEYTIKILKMAANYDLSFRLETSPKGTKNNLAMTINIYEPSGLGRFATGHSLTKSASRLWFVRVQRCEPQTTDPARPVSSLEINYSLAIKLYQFV